MPHAEMVPVNEVIVSNGSFIGRETGEKVFLQTKLCLHGGTCEEGPLQILTCFVIIFITYAIDQWVLLGCVHCSVISRCAVYPD